MFHFATLHYTLFYLYLKKVNCSVAKRNGNLSLYNCLKRGKIPI